MQIPPLHRERRGVFKLNEFKLNLDLAKKISRKWPAIFNVYVRKSD